MTTSYFTSVFFFFHFSKTLQSPLSPLNCQYPVRSHKPEEDQRERDRESETEIARERQRERETQRNTLANYYAAESIIISITPAQVMTALVQSATLNVSLPLSLPLVSSAPPSSLNKLALSLCFAHSSLLFKHTLLIQTICVYNSFYQCSLC